MYKFVINTSAYDFDLLYVSDVNEENMNVCDGNGETKGYNSLIYYNFNINIRLNFLYDIRQEWQWVEYFIEIDGDWSREWWPLLLVTGCTAHQLAVLLPGDN